jgi:hypothetical protein
MGRLGETRSDRILPGFWLRVSLSPLLLVWPNVWLNVSGPTLELFLERTT